MESPAVKRQFIFNDKRLDDFLEVLARTNNPVEAADLVGITLFELLQLRKTNAKFEYWYKEAAKLGFMSWESEAYRRAVIGVSEDIHYKGTKIGSKIIYSDSLLQFLLAAENPEKYGRQKIDVTSKVDVADKLAAARKRTALEKPSGIGDE